ncbi:hypothetical protein M422DRAFT_54648 [Sphaerobolus stellatus SS14]|uniref:Ubiquitin-like protease family profile domain-containing protein n=1 Tax=Sphaerobolus stellatus (strain SS14) TaxID=990650 RepID=A0A0C9USX0_SPHS4|nr:hypothetical protein M422DRAFT_54648 [Sphaerobolus stellatus SS14]
MIYHVRLKLRDLHTISNAWWRALAKSKENIIEDSQWVKKIDEMPIFHNACDMLNLGSFRGEGLEREEEFQLVSSDDGSNSSGIVESDTEEEDVFDDLIARVVDEEDYIAERLDVILKGEDNHKGPSLGSISGGEDEEVQDATAKVAEEPGHIMRILNAGSYLNGRVISTFADFLIENCGEDCNVDYVPPTIWLKLADIRRYQSVMDEPRLAFHLNACANLLQQVRPPNTCNMWLIPVNVPEHWIMVMMNWHQKQIWHFDSLPGRPVAKSEREDILKNVGNLLQPLRGHFNAPMPLDGWEFLAESRGTRQKNSVDCGAFLAVDIDSLLRYGVPSGLQQEDMLGWEARNSLNLA